MKKITPFLWFDAPIESVIKYYCAIFKDSKVVERRRYGKKVITATFRLCGQEFMILNGGPHFKFNPAVSFFVDCKTQAEVDRLWNVLSRGGEKSHCGWVRDKYGLSWQIVPSILGPLLADPDPAKANRVWQAMLQMSRLDIKTLKQAHAGKIQPIQP